MQNELVLQTQGLSKDFGGVQAVRKVDLSITRGSIHALIGPNGAGKTTLFNLITGFLRPTSGRIMFEGSDITGSSPAKMARMGLVRSFQMSSLFPQMTTAQNIRMAVQAQRGSSFDFWSARSVLSHLDAKVEVLLSDFDLSSLADQQAGELPYGRKRALELAMTLACSPRLILLDEPTSGMGAEDIAALTALIKKAAVSATIVMVEHNLKAVADLSTEVSVLVRGAIIAHGTYAQMEADPLVQQAYLGHRPHSPHFAKAPHV
ncbi:MAG: ABC transporter ATP-binding protein [Alphaproteobacteria bacterium]|nr:ABC transporter ATP-binding protein [Alphaproteobacteria bacterium]